MGIYQYYGIVINENKFIKKSINMSPSHHPDFLLPLIDPDTLSKDDKKEEQQITISINDDKHNNPSSSLDCPEIVIDTSQTANYRAALTSTNVSACKKMPTSFIHFSLVDQKTKGDADSKKTKHKKKLQPKYDIQSVLKKEQDEIKISTSVINKGINKRKFPIFTIACLLTYGGNVCLFNL